MSKYLPEYGWNPIIITVKSGAYTSMDENLEQEVDPKLEVFKTGSIDPYRIYNVLRGETGKNLPEAMSNLAESKSAFQKFANWTRSNLFIPDPKIGWAMVAYKQAKKLCKERKIDAIISTGPPNSTHLAGMKLSRKTGIPWMMDFRDPWTNNFLVSEILGRSKWAERQDLKLETKALKRADSLVVVSDGMKRDYESKTKKVTVIHNGYDEEDYKSEVPQEKGEKFTLSYIGSLKPNHDVQSLWEAIGECCKENKEFAEQFRIEFLGSTNEVLLNKLREAGCSDQILLQGMQPHKFAVQRMQSTDMLLFIIPLASYNKTIITGKLFEYIGSKTPIFSVGPTDGDAAKVIAKLESFPMNDYQDKQQMKQQLLSAFGTWKESKNGLPKLKGGRAEAFTRRSLTQDLANILNEMIDA